MRRLRRLVYIIAVRRPADKLGTNGAREISDLDTTQSPGRAGRGGQGLLNFNSKLS